MYIVQRTWTDKKAQYREQVLQESDLDNRKIESGQAKRSKGRLLAPSAWWPKA